MTGPASSTSYDDDFFVWTQRQSAALRRIPAHAVGNEIDIEHVAEEIEDLGRRDLREVISLIRLMFEHLLKIQACPLSPSARHWRAEIRAFQRAALDAFTPGMRKLVEISKQWRRALTAAQEDLRESGIEVTLPAACPFGLDDLLCEPFDVDAALQRMVAATARPPKL